MEFRVQGLICWLPDHNTLSFLGIRVAIGKGQEVSRKRAVPINAHGHHNSLQHQLCKWLTSWIMPGILLYCPAASISPAWSWCQPPHRENPRSTYPWNLPGCDGSVAKHKKKRCRKEHTPFQTGSYKPNGSFEIESCLAILLKPDMIWFYL